MCNENTTNCPEVIHPAELINNVSPALVHIVEQIPDVQKIADAIPDDPTEVFKHLRMGADTGLDEIKAFVKDITGKDWKHFDEFKEDVD